MKTTHSKLTFAELAPLSRFKWKSNLGAGDEFQKLSDTQLKNLKTGRISQIRESYFGPTDPVRLI